VLALGIVAFIGTQTPAGTALAPSLGGWSPTTPPQGYAPNRGFGMMGGGMMGGWNPIAPTQGYTTTIPYRGGMMGGGMMGGWGWNRYSTSGTPLTMDQAIQAARQYLAAWGNPDLVLTEVMEFDNHFYAEVEEKSTKIHAFEILIDRYTGIVTPEPGPNMMWNVKYGMMGGGMMGGWGRGYIGAAPTANMPVSAGQARQNADQYLATYLPGAKADEDADAFYGYYTIHVVKDGKTIGMLSVNGYTGQVWYHTWHGTLLNVKKLD